MIKSHYMTTLKTETRAEVITIYGLYSVVRNNRRINIG